jgi:hypothetical protein
VANYLEYHTDTPPLLELSSKYNFDDDFRYEICTYNNREVNKEIVDSIARCLPLWTTAPTLDSLDARFDAGSFVMYQYYKDTLCGWFWLNEGFTHDWVNVKELKPNSIYVGGIYKLLDKDLPKHCANDFGHYMMKWTAERYDYVYAIIEDWNKASVKLFEVYKVFRVSESFIND